MAIALTGLRLWDGRSDAAVDCLTLRVEGERIAGIGSAPELAQNARVLDLTGAFALPGLIDAHVHMSLDPAIGPPGEQGARSPEAKVAGMQARARASSCAIASPGGRSRARGCSVRASRSPRPADTATSGAGRRGASTRFAP
jgi:imidazolonepropionase-like amidohydrolase